MMRGTIRSELTKILSLPAVWIIAAALLVLDAAVQLSSLSLYADAVTAIDANGMISIFVGERRPAVAAMTEQLIAGMFVPVPLVPIVGAVIAGSEFRTGQIGAGVSATPSRLRLVAAQGIAATLFTIGLCAGFALLNSAVMYPVVADWRPGILADPRVLAGYLDCTLIAVCATLVALGITLTTRRTSAGVLVMALLLGLTISQVVAAVSPALDAALPFSAARNLLFHDSAGITPPLTSGAWTAAAVLVGWAAPAVTAAAVLLGRRDAR